MSFASQFSQGSTLREGSRADEGYTRPSTAPPSRFATPDEFGFRDTSSQSVEETYVHSFTIWLDPGLFQQMVKNMKSMVTDPRHLDNLPIPVHAVPLSIELSLRAPKVASLFQQLQMQLDNLSIATNILTKRFFETNAERFAFYAVDLHATGRFFSVGNTVMSVSEFVRNGGCDAYLCFSPLKRANRVLPVSMCPTPMQLHNTPLTESSPLNDDETELATTANQAFFRTQPSSAVVNEASSASEEDDVPSATATNADAEPSSSATDEFSPVLGILVALAKKQLISQEVAETCGNLVFQDAPQIQMAMRAFETDNDLEALIDSLNIIADLERDASQEQSSAPTASEDAWPSPVYESSSSQPTQESRQSAQRQNANPVAQTEDDYASDFEDAEAQQQAEQGADDEPSIESLEAERAKLTQMLEYYQTILQQLQEAEANAQEYANQADEASPNSRDEQSSEVNPDDQTGDNVTAVTATDANADEDADADADADLEDEKALEARLLEMQTRYAQLQAQLNEEGEREAQVLRELELIEKYEAQLRAQQEQDEVAPVAIEPSQVNSKNTTDGEDQEDDEAEDSASMDLAAFGKAVIEQLYRRNIITAASGNLLLDRIDANDEELLDAFLNYVQNDQISDLIDAIRDVLEKHSQNEIPEETEDGENDSESQTNAPVAGNQQNTSKDEDPENEDDDGDKDGELSIQAILQYVKTAERLDDNELTLIHNEYMTAYRRELEHGQLGSDANPLSLEDIYELRYMALSARTRELTERAEALRRDLDATNSRMAAEEGALKSIAALEKSPPPYEQTANEADITEPRERIRDPWIKEALDSVDAGSLSPEERQQFLQSILMRALLSGELNMQGNEFEDEDEDEYFNGYDDDGYIPDDFSESNDTTSSKSGPQIQVLGDDHEVVDYDSLPEPEKVVAAAALVPDAKITSDKVGTPRKDTKVGSTTGTPVAAGPQTPAREDIRSPSKTIAMDGDDDDDDDDDDDGGGGGPESGSSLSQATPTHGRRAQSTTTPIAPSSNVKSTPATSTPVKSSPVKSLNLMAGANVVAGFEQQQERHASAEYDSPDGIESIAQTTIVCEAELHNDVTADVVTQNDTNSDTNRVVDVSKGIDELGIQDVSQHQSSSLHEHQDTEDAKAPVMELLNQGYATVNVCDPIEDQNSSRIEDNQAEIDLADVVLVENDYDLQSDEPYQQQQQDANEIVKHETMSTASGLHVQYAEPEQVDVGSIAFDAVHMETTPRFHLPSAVDADEAGVDGETASVVDPIHVTLDMPNMQEYTNTSTTSPLSRRSILKQLSIDDGMVYTSSPRSQASRTPRTPHTPQTSGYALMASGRDFLQTRITPEQLNALEVALEALQARNALPSHLSHLEPRKLLDVLVQPLQRTPTPVSAQRVRLPSLTPPANPSQELLQSALEVYDADHDLNALQASLLLILDTDRL